MADVQTTLHVDMVVDSIKFSSNAQSQMNGAGGGGASGGAPALAGAMTAATMVLKEFIKNSKIVNVVQTNIQKAMGLLVDVILMPFLPLIAFGLINLFKGIMVFKGWWDEAITKIKEGGLLGLLEVGLDLFLVTSPIAWLVNFVWTMMFGTDEDKKKSLEFSVNLWMLWMGFCEWLLKPLLDYAFNAGVNTRKLIDLAFSLFYEKCDELIEWLWSVFSAGAALVFDLFGWILEGPLKWLYDAIKSGTGVILKVALDVLGGGKTNDSNYYDPTLGWKQSGGYIPQTGKYMLHKGETVIPSGGSGGITVNITGSFQSDQEMYDRFVDRLRREQWRTNV